MADALQIGVQEARQCYNCDWSFRVQPTHKELKQGVALLIYFCAHKTAHKDMPGGEIIPMRCDDMRTNPSLCGNEGKHWKEYKEVPLFSFELRAVRSGRTSSVDANVSNTPKHSGGPIIREPGATRQIEPPKSKVARKPYEVR